MSFTAKMNCACLTAYVRMITQEVVYRYGKRFQDPHIMKLVPSD